MRNDNVARLAGVIAVSLPVLALAACQSESAAPAATETASQGPSTHDSTGAWHGEGRGVPAS
jgi:hypothetical protein